MSPLVMVHATAATLAVPLGAWLLLAPKGSGGHKLGGRIWFGLMAVAAVTSFWITGVGAGHFSWIHILSVAVLIGLVLAVVRVRQGNIAGHRSAVRGLMIGLVMAGAGALLPGRSLAMLLYQ